MKLKRRSFSASSWCCFCCCCCCYCCCCYCCCCCCCCCCYTSRWREQSLKLKRRSFSASSWCCFCCCCYCCCLLMLLSLLLLLYFKMERTELEVLSMHINNDTVTNEKFNAFQQLAFLFVSDMFKLNNDAAFY